MAAVCQKCGDRGYYELLIYCVKCQISAEHWYCLDIIPRKPPKEVVWSCEQCMIHVSSAGAVSPENITSSVKRKRNGEPSGSSIEVQEWLPGTRVLESPSSIVCNQPLAVHQAYTDAIPLHRSTWRGYFDHFPWKYGPLKAHLSIKACQRVVNVAKKLPKFLHVSDWLSHDDWPQSLQITPPTDENIGLYFFPERHKMRLDKLEKATRIKTLRVILDEAELLVFSSYLLPQKHQRIHGQFYLWGLFRRRQPPMPKQLMLDTYPKIKLPVLEDSMVTEEPLGSDRSMQSTYDNRGEENIKPIYETFENNCTPQVPCLNLFPLMIEDMALRSRMGRSSIKVDLDLGLASHLETGLGSV
ncbi:hypothetical protein QJS10_CPA02g00440 [Acorus calamus]|uniref:AIPP2-like SPOC-like domain-containing protein n=1 Tax=Acorus calamus TaxID=4465 RepID=A0AAV9FDM2_ACOCL|nr:hypothetical protein QJS10_CPA02g00440 [Acorus calamus]